MKDMIYLMLGGACLLVAVPVVWLGHWCHRAIGFLRQWERENNENTKNQDSNTNL